MNLADHTAAVRDHLLLIGQAAGGPVAEAAERLALAVEPALRLALQDVVGEVARAVTEQVDGVNVEVRLEEGEPVVVATRTTPEETVPLPTPNPTPTSTEDGDGDDATIRFTLRISERLKARVDDAAGREGVSVNTWFVRAAERAVPASTQGPATGSRGRLTGWVG